MGKRGKKRPAEGAHGPTPTMLTIAEAAEALRCSVRALQQRCRRAKKGLLTEGFVAVKFGREWRVRLSLTT